MNKFRQPKKKAIKIVVSLVLSLVLFAAVVHTTYAWSAPQVIPGDGITDFAPCALGGGGTYYAVFHTGRDGNIYRQEYFPDRWEGRWNLVPESSGTAQAPACTIAFGYDVLVRVNSATDIYAKMYNVNDGKWSSDYKLPGQTNHHLAIWGASSLYVAELGFDGRIRITSSRDGMNYTDLVLVPDDGTRTQDFALIHGWSYSDLWLLKATDNGKVRMITYQPDSGSFGSWTDVPTNPDQPASKLGGIWNVGRDRIDLVTISGDSSIHYYFTRDGGKTWSGDEQIPGLQTNQTPAVQDGWGQTYIFVKGLDNKLLWTVSS